MKKLFYSVLMFGLFSTAAHADHILGGDITYTHLEGSKYRVNVTMFRDCEECLLAGRGGGNNTKDCGGFDLYLYTVQSSICSRNLIEKVPVTFVSYQSILNLCSDAGSKCSESPNFAYGIEAHHYTGVVDFSKYQDYKSCNFELSIQTPMRKDNLTNISGTEQYFFTYTELNPWIAHHSPEFREDPTLLLNCGKDFSENILDPSSLGDSIHVGLATPLKSRTSALTYAGDYTKDVPLRVWCGADAGCSPDISSSPVKGFYVNSQNGLVAFNPVNCNEKAVVVYEVRKWTRDEFGNYTLVSKVRRDIQYTVASVSGNHSPAFASEIPDMLAACIGQKESLEIMASDAITMTPSGPMPADTVRFEVLNPPPGLTYEVTAIPDAPYYKLDIFWEPLAGDAGKSFDLIVRVTDNACPMMASMEKVITLYANPSPQPELLVQKLNCGHLAFEETTGEGNRWSWNLKGLTSDWTGFQRHDTLRIVKAGSYTFSGMATGENGCMTTVDTLLDYAIDDILIDLIDAKALEYSVCMNDSLHLKAEIVSSDEFTAKWVTSDGLRQYNGQSVSLPFSLIGPTGEWQLWVETIRNGLKCSDIQPVTIDVLPLPDVSAWEFKEVCYGSNVQLMDGVSPQNGRWEVRHKSEQNWSLVEDNVFVTTQWEHKHFDTEYLLKYTVTDDVTGCSSKVPAVIYLKRVPQMELKDLEVCATGSRLSLKVLVDRPYVYETGRFTWTGLDALTTFEFDQNGDWLAIPSGVLGPQRIVAVNKTGFGCESTDTCTINILEDIKIELTPPGMICQDNKDIDLSLLTQLNTRSGNWFSPDRQEWIVNGMLSSEACGKFRVGYVVDQFGCYDYQEFTLDVRCKPDFQIDLPDTVCKNMDVILLSAAPAGGNWYGEGVRNRELDLSLVSGPVNLKYVYLDGICSYEAKHTVVVEESPVIEVGEYPQSICEGDAIEIEGIHFENAQWNIDAGNGEYEYDAVNHRIVYQPSEDEVLTGVAQFVLTAVGKGICKTEQVTLSTKINPTPKISFTANAYQGCAPFEFRLNSKSENVNVDLSDVQFEWNFGDPGSGSNNVSGNANPVHQYNIPGSYDLQLVAKHKLGCEYRTSQSNAVTVWPSPEAEFMMNPDGVVSTFNPRVSFINLSKGDNLSFTWDFGDGINRSSENPIHEFPSDTGTYKVMLRTENGFGCSDVFVDYVYVGPDIRIFIPNAFTPDSKGPVATETFSVQGQNIRDVKVTIYNRWGEIMTVFYGLDGNWDGTFRGTLCMSGVYFYDIEAVSVTGHTYEYRGTLTLIR